MVQIKLNLIHCFYKFMVDSDDYLISARPSFSDCEMFLGIPSCVYDVARAYLGTDSQA